MSSEPVSRAWPWAGIDPARWMASWWRGGGGGAPQQVPPRQPPGGVTINGVNSTAPQTEMEILQHHSYGRQLGRMADALQALIEERGEEAPTDQRFEEFVTMKRQIDDLKLDAAATRLDRVRADLAALKAARPAEYRRLRDDLQRLLDQ